MKTKILLLAFLLPLFALAGKLSENSSVAISFAGTTEDGKAVINVTNKQSCEAEIMVINGTYSVTKTVAANSTDTVQLIPMGVTKVTAKTLTDCGGGDRSPVEITVQSLPVKFTSFTATVKNYVELKWSTEEENVSHFNIQESTNGSVWVTITTLQAGNGKYIYIDNSPVKYYRIESVDIDGSKSYSKVLRVSFNQDEELSFYPNPVQNTGFISLGSSEGSKITIYSVSGVAVRQINTKGKNVVSVDLTGLQSGTYYISNGSRSLKVIKN